MPRRSSPSRRGPLLAGLLLLLLVIGAAFPSTEAMRHRNARSGAKHHQHRPIAVPAVGDGEDGLIVRSPVPVSVGPAVSADAPPPATLKIYVHQKTVTLVQGLIDSIILNYMTLLTLPDMTLPIVGGSVNVTNLRLSDGTFVAQPIGLVPTRPMQATMDINDIQGNLDFDWKYSGPLGITMSGTAHCVFSESTLSTGFTLAADAQGRPSLSMDTISVNINKLSVTLNDGIVGWLLDLLIALFKGVLVDTLQTEIASMASTVFASVTQAVEENWPVAVSLSALTPFLNNTQLMMGLVPLVDGDQQSELAFSLSAAGDYVVVSVEAGFSSLINSTTDERPHQPIPATMPLNPSGSAPMLGITWSESVIGTLLYTLEQNGKLVIGPITDADLPPTSLIRLNTALFAVEWPDLYSKYPNYNMSLLITSYGGPPSATSSPSGAVWSDVVVVHLDVIDPTQAPGNNLVPVAQLMANVSLSNVLALAQNATGIYIEGKVAPLDLQLSVLWAISNPGSLAPTLQALISALVNDMVLPILDQWLSDGVLISTGTVEAVHLSNAFVQYGDHTATFGLDLALPPVGTEGHAQAVEMMNHFRKPTPQLDRRCGKKPRMV